MPLNIDIQQILLHMLNFTVLVAAVYFLFYNPIKKFMDNRNNDFDAREKQISDDLAQAENAKKEYEEKLASFNAQVDKMKTESENEAAEKARRIIADAEDKAKDILTSAREKAKTEHDEIIASAYGEITKLAEEEAEKVVFADTQHAYDCFLDTVENEENSDK